MQTGRKIGILGGTFNPPHYGHLYICENVYSEYALNEVWLMPVGQPPHKRTYEVASKADRAAMTKLLVAQQPFLVYCDIEIDREGYTYTIDTLRALKKGALKGDTIYYIVGTDTLLYMESWKDIKDVLPLAEFVCVLRPGDDIAKVQEKRQWYETHFNKSIWLSKAAGPDISSTNIRKRAAEGEVLDGMLPESIAAYIKEHHLYERE